MRHKVIMWTANGLGLGPLSSLLWDGKLAVLMYHYFCADDEDPTSLTIRRNDFERHIRHLKNKFNVMPLPEAMDLIHRGTKLPKRSVAVTIDDVGNDFREHAWPVIKQYGAPVTLAVCPGFSQSADERSRLFGVIHAVLRSSTANAAQMCRSLGLPSVKYEDAYAQIFALPLDRMRLCLDSIGVEIDNRTNLPGLVHLPLLDLDWIAEAHKTGLLEVASHTMTHPTLARVTGEWLRWEIRESAKRIRSLFGTCNMFFYPGGGRTVPASIGREILDEAGYRYAFTVDPRIVSAEEDRFECGRITIDGTERLAGLKFRASGIIPMVRQRFGKS